MAANSIESGTPGSGEALTERDAIESVLNSIGDIVYVADPETFELLYVNEQFKKTWGDHVVGKQCFHVIQGRSEPCLFCTNKRIFGNNLGNTYVGEVQNEANKRWYRCQNRAIKWTDGRWVRFEQASDITDFITLQSRLADRAKELACVNRISVLLHGNRISGDVLAAVAQALPPGWQYPSLLRSRIVIDGQEYVSSDFKESPWFLEAAIEIHRVCRGVVQAYYLDNVTDTDDPFLPEERELLGSIGRILSEAIERSETQGLYEDLYENAPDMYAMVNAHTGVVEKCNRRLLEKTGFSQVDVIGRPVEERYTNASRAAANLVFEVLLEKKRASDVVLQLRHNGGGSIDVSLSASTVRDQHGEVTHFRLSWRDISVRKRLERVLAAEEEGFRNLVEMMPIGWAMHEMVFDDDGEPVDYVFLNANSSFERLTGIPLKKALGHRATEVMEGIRERTPDLIALYGEVTVTGKARTFELFYEPTGRWYRITAFHRKDGRFATMFEDISEMKASELELRELNENLRRSNEELQQFAYVASHDLQEPLRMVASYTQLLAQYLEGRLDEKAARYVDYAVDGAERMQRLISDLLEFSRVGTRGKPLEPTSCEAVLAEVLRDLQGRIDDSGAEIRFGDLPSVMADRTQLGQIFRNLLSNALKFHGDDPPKVEVSARREGAFWAITVSDNGIGIDPAYHERIFAIFQRLHSRAKYPGTGIGLAVVKKIVERHGGSVLLDSAEGKGARFTFTLPATHTAA